MVNRKKEKLLTEVELELMVIVWELKECTVRQIQEHLAKGRDLAYTSVATMVKILEQKGMLKSTKKDRAHTFIPLVTKETYEGRTLNHIKDHLFQGSPRTMVARLIDESGLDVEELDEIKKLLEERLSK
jgi:predicted transcriptional regulator